MNYIIVFLLSLIAVLQYDLWFGKNSIQEVKRLEQAVFLQNEENRQLQERNNALKEEVLDLKFGLDAIEERVRTELGMIQKDEIFFHVIEKK